MSQISILSTKTLSVEQRQVFIDADFDLLEQENEALLQNAIDASYPKDNIYVNIKSDNKYTEIEIRNPVLKYYSHEETNKFFTYGYSSKNTATTASHGMGLYYLKIHLAT